MFFFLLNKLIYLLIQLIKILTNLSLIKWIIIFRKKCQIGEFKDSFDK